MARQADLLSVEDARDRILSRFHALPPETVALEHARGRILAADVEAPATVPPFANSSMDGFAIQSSSTVGASKDRPISLRVTALVQAGSALAVRVGQGEAARIMTGGPLPDGADAVVPFEEVEDTGTAIRVRTTVRPGACVRPAGQDMTAGAAVLRGGSELHAPQIGLLAALGIAEVDCTRRPVVAILSTGDELVAPGTPLGPGQIYNSNGPMIAAAVIEAGGVPKVLATAGDDLGEIERQLDAALGVDLLLTSGGASVGDFDHVKSAIGARGEIGFWRVRVRPGKPLIFGSLNEVPVIGLPGNPTSAMVTFEIFARPALRAMLGTTPLRPEIEVVAGEQMDNTGGRRTYARVLLRLKDGRFHAYASGAQDSAMLLPLAQADALLVIPETVTRLRAGEPAKALVWRFPESETAPA